MKTSPAVSPAAVLLPVVRIAVIYDSRPAGQRAMESCRRIAERVADEVEVRTELWKSSVLELPAVRESALQSLERADVVLVAGEDGARLSDELRAFLHAWASGTQHRRATMLAYRAPLSAAAEDDQQFALAFLEQIVQDSGCELLVESPDCRRGDAVPAGWRLVRNRELPVARWQPPRSCPAPSQGINDQAGSKNMPS
jgi:hypothetical protein